MDRARWPDDRVGPRDPVPQPAVQPEERIPGEFKALAPGLVLELATIERCFEQGIEAHELLGADEPYKLRFSTSRRRHRVFRAFPRRPVPALRYAWRRYAPRSLRERRHADGQSGSAKSP
jgi:hypothetical protein